MFGKADVLLFRVTRTGGTRGAEPRNITPFMLPVLAGPVPARGRAFSSRHLPSAFRHPRSLLPIPHSKIHINVQVSKPDVSPTRIRLDTSGGFGYLTACLPRSADAVPVFIVDQESL